jgi:hypothetical protein
MTIDSRMKPKIGRRIGSGHSQFVPDIQTPKLGDALSHPQMEFIDVVGARPKHGIDKMMVFYKGSDMCKYVKMKPRS